MAKKMYYIVFTGIFVASFVFLMINPNLPEGSLLKNVTWDLSEEDKFYYGVFDDYYKYEDAVPTLHYGALLKSEILEMEDYSGDPDFSDDLLISSSALVGDESAGYEIPMFFDLYHILGLINDYSELTQGWSIGDPANMYYSDLSALHLVYSAYYTALNDFIESQASIANLDLGITELPYFTDLSAVLQLLGMFVDVDSADFRFSMDTVGSLPDWWNWTSTDKTNNFAGVQSVSDTTFDKVFAMNQEVAHTDPNSISLDVLPYLYSSLPSYYTLDESTLFKNWFNMSKVAFYYKTDYAETSNVEFKFTYPFDLFMYDTEISDYKEFSGENGVFVKLVGDELFVKMGDYQWDSGTGTYKTAAMTGIPSGTWLSIANLSSDLRRDIPLKYTFTFGSNTFNINIFDLYSNEEQLVLSVPYYMTFPVPNDRVQINEEYTFFPFNFHVLEINQDCGADAEFYLDNVAFDLENVIALDDSSVVIDYAELASESFLNSVMISIYHFCIFPKEYNMSKIRWIFDIINYFYQMFAQWLNISPPYLFKITDTEETLVVELTPQTIFGIFRAIGWKMNNILGDTITSFKIIYDKLGRVFKEAVLYTDYVELGYTRESGIRLLSTTREGDLYPDTLPEEYSLLRNIEFSSEQVNSLLKKMDLAGVLGILWQSYSTEILALAGIIVGASAFIGLGLTEIVRAIRRRTEV